MGINCSCFYGEVANELNIDFPNNQTDFKSFEGRSKQEAAFLTTEYQIEINDLIKFQSVLRGFIDRQQLKNINSSKSQTSSQIVQKNPKRSITEFPENKLPEYLNPATSKIIAQLGPLVHKSEPGKGLISRKAVLMENNAIYIGQWNEDNQREGRGSQYWHDGSVYEGTWANDKANGTGRLIHSNGDVYEGHWENDRASGYGIYIHNYTKKDKLGNSCGMKYEGLWKNDKQHGKGTEYWPDGSRYSGDYEFGLKQGKGSFVWHDGSSYEGTFWKNFIHGEGIYKWKDGRVYFGQWKDNKMHGSGVFTWPDGRKYEGEYLDDKKHGNGVFTWKDGRRYEGQWKLGKQNGLGVYTSSNGVSKEGMWESGKKIQSI